MRNIKMISEFLNLVLLISIICICVCCQTKRKTFKHEGHTFYNKIDYQNAKKYNSINHKSPFQNFTEIPGSKNSFISKFEVSNLEYKEFLKDVKFKNKIIYSQSIVDTTLWFTKLDDYFNEPFLKEYSWFSFYNNYPVVNISHHAAMNYCEWLNNQISSNNKYANLKIRLPSAEEYSLLYKELREEIITDTLAYNSHKENYNDLKTYFNNGKIYIKWTKEEITRTNGNDLKSSLKIMLDELGYVVNINYLYDRIYHTAPVSSFEQTNTGICSLIGNVSEMTESGHSVGGNWDSLPSESFEMDTIKASDPRIGFRVVIEIKE